MVIDEAKMDELSARAKLSSRLREAMDLRTRPSDGSQRVLNALEPGTEVPIHRHPYTDETVIVIRGKLEELLFDDTGCLTERVTLMPGSCPAMQIPAGQWHTARCLETGTVIFEGKHGAYEPLREENTMILKFNSK